MSLPPAWPEILDFFDTPLAIGPSESLALRASVGSAAADFLVRFLRGGGPRRACARVSLGKGESDVRIIEETFRWNPVGLRAHPVEFG
jgi:hypothetical protein